MPHIEIISSSIRIGRNSHRVALYFKQYLEKAGLATVGIQDLAAYNFPLFEERLSYQPEVSKQMQAFANAIQQADGVLIVCPEYNGGYPAALKNVVDLLYPQWYRKPTAVVTVSDGDFGGSQVIMSLLFVLWKMKAWVIPAQFPVPNVDQLFTEKGEAVDQHKLDGRLKPFLKEFFWAITSA